MKIAIVGTALIAGGAALAALVINGYHPGYFSATGG